MPRPTLPLTPASSTEIAGKGATRLQMSLESGFALPPPALREKADPSTSPPETTPVPARQSSTKPSRKSSTQSITPKRRLSAANTSTGANDDPFELPPPPTRSRKIIHMEPRARGKGTTDDSLAALKSREISKAAAAATEGKKKQPTSTSVAGRKIARKTAHSLIERRRRSKMNEEFGVLKDMIPACKDQEMHKLAILQVRSAMLPCWLYSHNSQASIDYLRYLEQCVIDVRRNYDTTTKESGADTKSEEDEDEDETAISSPLSHQNEDEEMVDTPTSVSADAKQPYALTQPESPPCFSVHPIRDRYYSFSNTSTVVSPTFRPTEPSPQYSQSSSVSPAILPQAKGDRDIDHEATEALLMLNSDRRSNRGRGLSVKDLLSN